MLPDILPIHKILSSSTEKSLPFLMSKRSSDIHIHCFTFISFMNVKENINQHSCQNILDLVNSNESIL